MKMKRFPDLLQNKIVDTYIVFECLMIKLKSFESQWYQGWDWHQKYLLMLHPINVE